MTTRQKGGLCKGDTTGKPSHVVQMTCIKQDTVDHMQRIAGGRVHEIACGNDHDPCLADHHVYIGRVPVSTMIKAKHCTFGHKTAFFNVHAQ